MTQPRIPWTRLGAEFVVIVVGVLVALGVDSWRAGLQDRADRGRLLETLSDELRGNVAALDKAIADQQTYLAATRRLINISDGVEPVPDTATFIELVESATTYAYLNPTFSAYDAMIAAGQTSLLPDGALATMLARYRWELEHGHPDASLAEPVFLNLVYAVAAHGGMPAFRQAGNFATLGLPPTRRRPDIDGFRSDPAVLDNLYARLVVDTNITTWWAAQREHLVRTDSLIQEQLGR